MKDARVRRVPVAEETRRASQHGGGRAQQAGKESIAMFRNLSGWLAGLQRDPLGTVIEIVFMIAALVLSLMLHEIGHGFVALKCGDPTAKRMGRLSLDPRRHLDPIGAICMFFLGIGWARPVPVNPWNLRNRRRDMILVSFAGIFVNLILFLVTTFLYALSWQWRGQVVDYLQMFLVDMISFNISLAIFNLVPVPPLDGFRLVNEIFFRGELNLSPQTMQIIHFGFLFVCLSGILSTAFSRVCNFCLQNVLRFFMDLLY